MIFERSAGRCARSSARSRGRARRALAAREACGVCRTDLHLLDGEVEIAHAAADPRTPDRRDRARQRQRAEPDGRRVGVPWLGWTCGDCAYCRSGRENLCPRARFTGCDIDGGMAEYTVADERFCFPIPAGYPRRAGRAADVRGADRLPRAAHVRRGSAPRPLRLRRRRAHPRAGRRVSEGREVFAFTRAGDETDAGVRARARRRVGGRSDDPPPRSSTRAIIFAPVGALVPLALRALAPGATVVCGGIHMSDIPSFPYSILWQERVVRSVANLTRRDARSSSRWLRAFRCETRVTSYPLEAAGEALEDLRAGRFTGAAVMIPDGCTRSPVLEPRRRPRGEPRGARAPSAPLPPVRTRSRPGRRAPRRSRGRSPSPAPRRRRHGRGPRRCGGSGRRPARVESRGTPGPSSSTTKVTARRAALDHAFARALAGRRVLDRVVHEIAQRLREAVGIGDQGGPRGRSEFELPAASRLPFQISSTRAASSICWRAGIGLLGPGEQQHIVHEARDASHLGAHDTLTRRPPAGWVRAFREHFELSTNGRQWRPQLVRCVGDERPLRVEGLAQTVEHVVEGVREDGDLLRWPPGSWMRGWRSPASTRAATVAMRRSGREKRLPIRYAARNAPTSVRSPASTYARATPSWARGTGRAARRLRAPRAESRAARARLTSRRLPTSGSGSVGSRRGSQLAASRSRCACSAGVSPLSSVVRPKNSGRLVMRRARGCSRTAASSSSRRAGPARSERGPCQLGGACARCASARFWRTRSRRR